MFRSQQSPAKIPSNSKAKPRTGIFWTQKEPVWSSNDHQEGRDAGGQQFLVRYRAMHKQNAFLHPSGLHIMELLPCTKLFVSKTSLLWGLDSLIIISIHYKVYPSKIKVADGLWFCGPTQVYVELSWVLAMILFARTFKKPQPRIRKELSPFPILRTTRLPPATVNSRHPAQ